MRCALLFPLLLVCTPAVAQASRYDALLDEAVRLQNARRPGEPVEKPYERAYQKLFEAYKADPRRYEAPMQRGLNRCDLTVQVRALLVRKLNTLRVGGGTPAASTVMEKKGVHLMDMLIQQARQDFSVMASRLRAARIKNPELLQFAAASMKYARGDYLGKKGRTGAIDDLKGLFQKKWQPTRCAELLAQCYLQLGAIAYVRHKAFEEAQEYWDEALKWAQSESIKRSILTNKAGAYEASGSYGLAKRILRAQIERDPRMPAPWKNLGLLLGFEGKLREAIHAYGKTRSLCKSAQTSFFLGKLHGSAWLKAANIHGTLLRQDGDISMAWRLFLEYRRMFGDDYNFCVDFGRFSLELKQYEIAYAYLTRARDLQPFCRMPYHLLIRVTQRLNRPPEEVRKLAAEAGRNAKEARIRFNHHQDESPSVQRLCAGNIDRGDGSPVPGSDERMDPDPLAGLSLEQPPPWIIRAAQARKPFQPWEPAEDGSKTSPGSGLLSPDETPSMWPWAVSGGLFLAALGVVVLLRAQPGNASTTGKVPQKDR